MTSNTPDLDANKGAIFTGPFWQATGERAIRTFAQAAVAFVGADAIGIIQVDLVQGASVSGLAAALSILTSIAAGSASPVSGPSLGTEQPTGRAV